MKKALKSHCSAISHGGTALCHCLMSLEHIVCATAATSTVRANTAKLFLEYAELVNHHYGRQAKIGYNTKIFFLCFLDAFSENLSSPGSAFVCHADLPRDMYGSTGQAKAPG